MYQVSITSNNFKMPNAILSFSDHLKESRGELASLLRLPILTTNSSSSISIPTFLPCVTVQTVLTPVLSVSLDATSHCLLWLPALTQSLCYTMNFSHFSSSYIIPKHPPFFPSPLHFFKELQTLSLPTSHSFTQ